MPQSGSCRQEKKQKQWRNSTYRFAPRLSFNYLSYISNDQLLRSGTGHSCLNPSISTKSQENHTQTCLQATLTEPSSAEVSSWQNSASISHISRVMNPLRSLFFTMSETRSGELPNPIFRSHRQWLNQTAKTEPRHDTIHKLLKAIGYTEVEHHSNHWLL